MTSSAVWEYYDKIPGKRSVAKCLVCQKEYSYRTSITNLKKHLIYKHFDVYQNMNVSANNESDNNDNNGNNESNYEDTFDNPLSDFEQKEEQCYSVEPVSPSDITTSTIVWRTPKRIKIEQNFLVQHKKEIDKKILEMIIGSYEPFSIVEDVGFRNFVSALNPDYVLPNKKLISRKLVLRKFVICKTIITEMIQNARNVCITIDCWKSHNMDSYFTVTAHFVQDFQLKSVLLHCEDITYAHSVADLANCLQNIAEEYNITEKITLVITTNSNDKFRQAIEKNHWTYYDCFLHKFNLVIENAITVIDVVLKKVNRVIDHFKKSNIASEALLEYQRDYEKSSMPLKLIRSVPIRWNSIYYMLERFLKLQNVLEVVITNEGLDHLTITKEIWDAIKKICTLLQPFEEVTRIMIDAQYLSGSLALIIIDGLKNIISVMKAKQMFGTAKLFLEKLDEGLKINFPEKRIEDNMLMAVCTFIDPRFKMHAFLDYRDVERHVIELIKIKIGVKQQTIAENFEVGLTDPQSTIDIQEEPEPISIWGKMYKNIATTAPLEDISTKAKKELEMFLNDKLLHRDSCPLSWWKEHALVYPNLAEIFLDHCHVVITSVKCESVFTKDGTLLTHKRASLDRECTEELVFLHNNIGFCELE